MASIFNQDNRICVGARRRASRVAFLALSVSALATTASAQTASDAPSAGQTAGPVDSADIIVTARKQNERVSEVPIAIKAFSAEDLQRYATKSFGGLASQVAGLTIGNSSSSSSVVVNLRGIGSGTSAPTLDQAVSINLDGLQVPQGNLLKLGFHDVERVEVLKGPQALFYGKNSPGGVISLLSANPGQNFEASVKAGYEFAAQQKFIEGMVSAPITQELGVRVVGYVSDQKGWFRNVAPNASHKGIDDRTDYFLRGTLRYGSGGFDNTFKVSYGRFKQRNGLIGAGQLVACPQGHQANHPSPAFFTECKLDRRTSQGDISPATLALHPAFDEPSGYDKQKQLAFINSANFEVSDELSLASVSTYYKGRNDYLSQFSFGPRSILVGGGSVRNTQFTQELRAQSSYDGPINFMAGVFYQTAKFHSTSPVAADSGLLFTGVPNDIPVMLVDEEYRLKTTSYSVFGQLTFDVTPQVDFNVGGRFSHEEKTPSGTRHPTVFIPTDVSIVFPQPKSSFDNFSPELTLRYRPSDDFMVYGTYRHGFVSGGYNLVASSDLAPYDQEKVKGGEVGAKGALMNRQLRFDVAVYHYKYYGLQLSAFNGETLAYTVTNASDAKSYGVDLSTEFRPRGLPGLSLRAAVAWNHARYGSFNTAACYTGQTPALGCDQNPSPTGFLSQDLTGARLVRAADWSGNIGATYETPILGDHVLSLSADGLYKSKYNPMLEADPRAAQKSSWLLNATAALRSADKGWEIALIGKNLTNVLRLSESNSLGFTGFGSGTPDAILSDVIGQPTEPRAVMLQVTLHFGG